MIRIKWDDGGRLRWRNLEYVTGWDSDYIPKVVTRVEEEKRGQELEEEEELGEEEEVEFIV